MTTTTKPPELPACVVSIRPADGALPITATGDDTHKALLEWMKNELSRGTERAFDLGKFLFTVSIGTAGLLAALVKDARLLWPLILAIFLNALSAVAALTIAWPRTWSVAGEADLVTIYNRTMKQKLHELRRWAILYGFAFVASALAILARA